MVDVEFKKMWFYSALSMLVFIFNVILIAFIYSSIGVDEESLGEVENLSKRVEVLDKKYKLEKVEVDSLVKSNENFNKSLFEIENNLNLILKTTNSSSFEVEQLKKEVSILESENLVLDKEILSLEGQLK